ncbi:hypothetical protein [Amycolatopsis sp. H20-H5]|uniref:hypothetical protein n=1 Tax=Amycolatopsis sp. H20-H5 TaxID=3046309 RepID=UPI002DB7547C|nr:hypothetical protein [Amycolatopsis sp. H20-H5]MEC3976938.1 hypothetical protein [Amycolatopsis sp. H20-H5]
MSAAKRQRTCACCGTPFRDGQRTEVEPFIDDAIRYLAVLPGHSTYPPRPVRRLVPRAGPETPPLADAA